MKRFIKLLLFSACCLSGNAQEHVLDYEGDLYFIPASMTKYGQPFLYSRNQKGFTVYDGDLNVIKIYSDPLAGTTYQKRIVHSTCLVDPETKEILTEWTVVEDQTFEEAIYAEFKGCEIYSDDNSYHSRMIYLSQTLFDDDEDFEFIQSDRTVIPITVKTQDYINEHSENSTEEGDKMTIDPLHTENDWWRDMGANDCSMEWDNERNKMVYILYKIEKYGGLFYSSLKIKSMDGTVKQTLNGINISYAYNYRGNCYVRGNVSGKLYRIGTKKDKTSQTRRGDVDDNGVVNVADHVKLSSIIMDQNSKY